MQFMAKLCLPDLVHPSVHAKWFGAGVRIILPTLERFRIHKTWNVGARE